MVIKFIGKLFFLFATCVLHFRTTHKIVSGFLEYWSRFFGGSNNLWLSKFHFFLSLASRNPTYFVKLAVDQR